MDSKAGQSIKEHFKQQSRSTQSHCIQDLMVRFDSCRSLVKDSEGRVGPKPRQMAALEQLMAAEEQISPPTKGYHGSLPHPGSRNQRGIGEYTSFFDRGDLQGIHTFNLWWSRIGRNSRIGKNHQEARCQSNVGFTPAGNLTGAARPRFADAQMPARPVDTKKVPEGLFVSRTNQPTQQKKLTPQAEP